MMKRRLWFPRRETLLTMLLLLPTVIAEINKQIKKELM
jgi:hypothetical protein